MQGMESEEALRYFLDEIKDTPNDINLITAEEKVLNEVEQAADFLSKAGLTNLISLNEQGKEISENVLDDSISSRNLTEKQAQTIRSRVATLNKTLRGRQPRKKHRQDVRDVAWNLETSSTGTRSRSATPDSLDSSDNPNYNNEDLTSDEDQQLSSLPPFVHSGHPRVGNKSKIKCTLSEPLQNKKFSRNDKGDVAHSNSENVVLKGYQPLTESGSLPRSQRERSGSDPTTEIHLKPLTIQNSDLCQEPEESLIRVSTGQSSVVPSSTNNCSRVYIHCNEPNENSALSFEGLIRQNENNIMIDLSRTTQSEDGVLIDTLSDSEYQYLKPLVYMELVAIFDQYKISYNKKKKQASKSKGGNVFGVNLSTLLMRDMPRVTDNSMVPQIFQMILDQLNERCINDEGILRIACQKQKLDHLCGEIEKSFYSNRKVAESIFQNATVHELCGILKRLIRELPDPLFTTELMDMFYNASAIPNQSDQLKAINLLVVLLPIEHRNTFKEFLNFLLNVIGHQDRNKMNLHNVGMITAPSFFPSRMMLPKDIKHIEKSSPSDNGLKGMAVCCLIVDLMLMAGPKLWYVPQDIIRQAKEAQIQAQNKKEKKMRHKTKLTRSSTQYEPGPMHLPRIKRDFFI